MSIHRLLLPHEFEDEEGCAGLVTTRREDGAIVYVVFSQNQVREIMEDDSDEATEQEQIAVQAALLALESSALPVESNRDVIMVDGVAGEEYFSLLQSFTSTDAASQTIDDADFGIEEDFVLQFSAMDIEFNDAVAYGTCEYQREGEPHTVIFYSREQAYELISELGWMIRMDPSFVVDAVKVVTYSLLPERSVLKPVIINGFPAFIINQALKLAMLEEENREADSVEGAPPKERAEEYFN